MISVCRLLCVLSTLALLPIAGAAAAQEGALRIELNRLEPQGESCRTYLLVENGGSPELRSLKLDLFALDTEGVAAKRVAVEVGPVPEKKTLIRLFDFAGLPCPKIGRVLLNGVIACEGLAGPREDCLSAIDTASKAGAVSFSK